MKDDRITSCLGIILGMVIVALVGAVLDGWALSTIWNWFMPPIFGLVSLSFAQAIGVSLVFSLFTGTKNSEKSSKENKSAGEIILEAIIVSIFKNVFIVLFGWIVLQFAF